MVTSSPPTSTKPLTAAWFGFGLASILLPLLIMTIGRAANSANQYNNGNGNNNYYNNNGNNNYNQNNNQNRDGEGGGGTPWWYWGGGGERWREGHRDDEKAPAVMVATYLWSLTVFSAILLYGHHAMRTGADLHGVAVALCLFANFALISMFLYGGVE